MIGFPSTGAPPLSATCLPRLLGQLTPPLTPLPARLPAPPHPVKPPPATVGPSLSGRYASPSSAPAAGSRLQRRGMAPRAMREVQQRPRRAPCEDAIEVVEIEIALGGGVGVGRCRFGGVLVDDDEQLAASSVTTPTSTLASQPWPTPAHTASARRSTSKLSAPRRGRPGPRCPVPGRVPRHRLRRSSYRP